MGDADDLRRIATAVEQRDIQIANATDVIDADAATITDLQATIADLQAQLAAIPPAVPAPPAAIPKLGVTVGDFSLTGTQAFEAAIGPVGVCGCFAEPGSPPPKRIGTHPMLHSPKWPIDVTDAAVAAYVKALVASGQADVALRWWWEFNGSFSQWHVDAVTFVPRWQHVYSVARANGWTGPAVWCPVGGDSLMHSTDRAYLDAHYPGDAYVDLVGLDPYGQSWPVHASWTDDLRLSQSLPQRQSWFAWHRDFARRHGKMRCFPEFGLTIRLDGTNTGAGTVDDVFYAADMIVEIAMSDVAWALYLNENPADGKHSLTSVPSQFPKAQALFAAAF